MRNTFRFSLSVFFCLSFFSACQKTSETPKSESAAREKPLAEKTRAEPSKTLVVYSGRNESLVGPLLKKFELERKVKLKIKYGKSAALSALLLEEGDKSPAALFLAQDAGALGALAKQKRLQPLQDDTLARVGEAYKDPDKRWVGITGRSRALVYNTKKLKSADVPNDVFALTNAKYKKRVGWAPANGSFQAFVTAMRKMHGEEKTKAWLVDMKKNGAREYPKNSAIVRATGAGEVDLGLVNHYYLYRFTKKDTSFAADNHYTKAGGVGALVNVSGAGILSSAKKQDALLAKELIDFLLSDTSQTHFATTTHEYPLVAGVKGPKDLPALSERKPPALNLSDLDDLKGTLSLLREAGVVP